MLPLAALFVPIRHGSLLPLGILGILCVFSVIVVVIVRRGSIAVLVVREGKKVVGVGRACNGCGGP
jgi:hypothetical protein